ncbi:acyltransferase family protein [Actinoalloteichus sp. GBA129-24]|uniref:acyltransferase family protein n=1 Tax=Actinoalloteichus sp. GBA129-24 TaxID=1612551 RepID=UPI0009509524|nr:acyltransferase [Actinoalloteichus sp. GBA129-24]APU22386.1 hypothetical protein UA75_21985 [Actinoalloteichus sp. GBA129-24]
MTTRARPRDPSIDLVRAVAVCGVVLGHWLVTPLTASRDGLVASSPLASLPTLTPLSWLLQPLGLFFLVGGYLASAGRRAGRGERAWRLGLRRFVLPVAALCGGWAVVFAVLAVRGLPQQTVVTTAQLIVSPLCVLGVYLLLPAVTPLARRLDARFGLAAALLPAALALLAEAVAATSPSGLAQAVGLTTVVTVWWVPWQLGTALAAGRRPGRLSSAVLVCVGVLGMAIAVTVFGYPAAGIGVPGAERSNLLPPSPVALALAVAQIGLVLLLWQPLHRIATHPIITRVVTVLNQDAMGILLLHQSALVVVSLVAARAGVLPGLHTVADDPGWLLLRLAWLPVFALVLLLLLQLTALGPRRVRRRRGTVPTREPEITTASACAATTIGRLEDPDCPAVPGGDGRPRRERSIHEGTRP